MGTAHVWELMMGFVNDAQKDPKQGLTDNGTY